MMALNYVRDGGVSLDDREIKRMLAHDGLVHGKPAGGEETLRSKGRHFYEPSPQMAKQIETCLNCKKKRCTGGRGCFRGE